MPRSMTPHIQPKGRQDAMSVGSCCSGNASSACCWRQAGDARPRTMNPDSQPHSRQKAMSVSWYSSGDACRDSTRSAGGSAMRATIIAMTNPAASVNVTLPGPQSCLRFLLWRGRVSLAVCHPKAPSPVASPASANTLPAV